MAETVLITGANGFVGSHIVDALLREGYEVRAAVRATSDLTWLQEKSVVKVEAPLNDAEALRKAADGVDYVLHNAGVTSQPHRSLYYLHNTEGTKTLFNAVVEVAPKLSRFLYVSSQAAGGSTLGSRPRIENDIPAPKTDYGRSKLLAEEWLLRNRNRLPVTIIRPPSVYGPRDKAFLPLFKMIERGVAPLIGRGSELNLIHVQDLARQVLMQMTHPKAVGEIFHAAPFPPVTHAQLNEVIAQVLGTKARSIELPTALLRYGYPLLYPLLETIGQAPFRSDKLPDVLAPRWIISGEKAKERLGFEGKIPLHAGMGQTVEWYRWKKWLTTRRDRMKKNGNGEVLQRQTSQGLKRYDPSCDLCGLVFDEEIKTTKYYEDDQIVIVDCLICQVPMAVLKEHRATFTEDEKTRLEKTFFDLFGKEGKPDWEQRRIPEHAHVHYRSHGMHLPWQRRPDPN
ncbi:MAG: NAD-dependent epimerase/dehydratase family protein [bacterium]